MLLVVHKAHLTKLLVLACLVPFASINGTNTKTLVTFCCLTYVTLIPLEIACINYNMFICE